MSKPLKESTVEGVASCEEVSALVERIKSTPDSAAQKKLTGELDGKAERIRAVLEQAMEKNEVLHAQKSLLTTANARMRQECDEMQEMLE